MLIKCQTCESSAIGTRIQLYQAQWRETSKGIWICNSHLRKGAPVLNFYGEAAKYGDNELNDPKKLSETK